MSVINADRLTVKYDSTTALDSISFTIEKGEFIGIIGPNGGGKSTLVKAMLGLIEADGGSIEVDRDAVVGYVPQFSTFDRNFPIAVKDVVLTGHLPKGLKMRHRFKGHDEEHAFKVMERLGIENLANRQIGELSGGQLQRVLIARAMMNHPTILVLDEPTASVDQATKEDIYEMMRELNKTITIILITHDTGTLWQYMDRCFYINKTVHIHNHDGDPEDLLENCPIEWFREGEKIQKALEENAGAADKL